MSWFVTRLNWTHCDLREDVLGTEQAASDRRASGPVRAVAFQPRRGPAVAGAGGSPSRVPPAAAAGSLLELHARVLRVCVCVRVSEAKLVLHLTESDETKPRRPRVKEPVV